MLFLPISLTLFLLFLSIIPILFVLAPAVAFAKLGLSPLCGYIFFLFCLIGSSINIPIYRYSQSQKHIQSFDELSILLKQFFDIKIPSFQQQVIAVNIGGAVLPTILSLYLLKMTPINMVIIATSITTIMSFMLSRPVKGVGIVMPAFVPPVIAAITAMLISKQYAPQLAYISGVMGTLIGADILRIPMLKELNSPFLSIGGAGVFDGIYLVGLVSVLLA